MIWGRRIAVGDAAGALLWGREGGRCGRAAIHVGCGGIGPWRTTASLCQRITVVCWQSPLAGLFLLMFNCIFNYRLKPHLGEDSGVVGWLVLFFLVSRSLLHLLSVRFLFPVCTFRLKNKIDDLIHQAEDGQFTSKTGP